MPLLLSCAVIGCPLFILVFLIEGATRRSGYRPFRHPVSSLSLGPHGWVQKVNFLITGFLITAFSFGLKLALRHSEGGFWGPLFLGLVGMGLIGAGIFDTDPILGYPIGTPPIPTKWSFEGTLHNLSSLPVFLGIPAASFVFLNRFIVIGEWGWTIYSGLSGIGMLVFFVLAGKGFSGREGFVKIGGGFQRLSIGIGWTWVTLLGIHFLKGVI
jgi:hypothetical protein